MSETVVVNNTSLTFDRVIYVNPTIGHDNYYGDITAPVKTMYKAEEIASNGDCIYLMQGEHVLDKDCGRVHRTSDYYNNGYHGYNSNYYWNCKFKSSKNISIIGNDNAIIRSTLGYSSDDMSDRYDDNYSYATCLFSLSNDVKLYNISFAITCNRTYSVRAAYTYYPGSNVVFGSSSCYVYNCNFYTSQFLVLFINSSVKMFNCNIFNGSDPISLSTIGNGSKVTNSIINTPMGYSISGTLDNTIQVKDKSCMTTDREAVNLPDEIENKGKPSTYNFDGTRAHLGVMGGKFGWFNCIESLVDYKITNGNILNIIHDGLNYLHINRVKGILHINTKQEIFDYTDVITNNKLNSIQDYDTFNLFDNSQSKTDSFKFAVDLTQVNHIPDGYHVLEIQVYCKTKSNDNRTYSFTLMFVKIKDKFFVGKDIIKFKDIKTYSNANYVYLDAITISDNLAPNMVSYVSTDDWDTLYESDDRCVDISSSTSSDKISIVCCNKNKIEFKRISVLWN